MEIASSKLSVKIITTENLYDILSKKYYLPNINCRCITKNYLMEFVKKEIKIFFMEKEKVVRHYFRKNKNTCQELLAILENLPISKKNFSTRIPPDQPPNKEWLLNAILHLAPDDPFKLLGPNQNDNFDYNIEVNQE